MKNEIKATMLRLTMLVNSETSADAALKYTQAILNLANALFKQNECDE